MFCEAPKKCMEWIWLGKDSEDFRLHRAISQLQNLHAAVRPFFLPLGTIVRLTSAEGRRHDGFSSLLFRTITQQHFYCRERPWLILNATSCYKKVTHAHGAL